MTYRLGHHSTSDDSTAYRSLDEVKTWEQKANPMVRFRRYITAKGLWSDSREDEFREAVKKEVGSVKKSACICCSVWAVVHIANSKLA